jgi:hypothetical protein
MMPRYYLNIHDSTPSVDVVGDELLDDATAWNEATIIAGELFKGIDGKFKPGQEWSLEVADEQRHPLFSILISAKQSR